jgi:hypothetical protein
LQVFVQGYSMALCHGCPLCAAAGCFGCRTAQINSSTNHVL